MHVQRYPVQYWFAYVHVPLEMITWGVDVTVEFTTTGIVVVVVVIIVVVVIGVDTKTEPDVEEVDRPIEPPIVLELAELMLS